jgi:AraC-like DNA-binding protein
MAIDSNRVKLLLAFIQAAWEQWALLADDADWRECVSRIALDLALRAIGQSVEMDICGAPAELRRLVLEHVRANITDPSLRTSAIAKALHVRLRTERGKVSITQIAYDSGFSDSAYFSRCFQKTYGLSPRNYFS